MAKGRVYTCVVHGYSDNTCAERTVVGGKNGARH